MFSIKGTRRKMQMNFTGSPQCGNAGDLKFTVSIEGKGNTLDSDGFVFDSVSLHDLFEELQRGHWRGSCEGIGVYCCEWLFKREPSVNSVKVTIVTESTNELTIELYRGQSGEFADKAIKQV